MKRMIALLLGALMALTVVPAFADSRTLTPSKTIDDLYKIVMTVEDEKVEDNLASLVSAYNISEDEKVFVEAINGEVEAFKEAKDVEHYFSENEFSAMKEMDEDAVSLTFDDIIAFKIAGYDKEMGKAAFVLSVPKLYEKDEPVVIAMKLMKTEENAEPASWMFIKGLGTEDGDISFEIEDADMLLKIQESFALVELFSHEK